jgi:hypothetical protein
MIRIDSKRVRGLRTPLRATACAAALLLAGCVTYSPSQLSAMSAVDICEATDVQAHNLSAETRAAMQSELQRRNESCSKYSSVVAQRRQDFLDRETYGKQSP